MSQVAKKEGCNLPKELAGRIAEKSNRNLRRAILMVAVVIIIIVIIIIVIIIIVIVIIVIIIFDSSIHRHHDVPG